MPRGKKRTTQSGHDAQDIESVPGQRYGEGVDQQALQRAMPAPNIDVVGDASAPTPQNQSMLGAAPADLASAFSGAPTGLLRTTGNPNQPITAGLTSGPGPGPEAFGGLGPSTPLARTLRTLSARSGDPRFAQLADRAGL